MAIVINSLNQIDDKTLKAIVSIVEFNQDKKVYLNTYANGPVIDNIAYFFWQIFYHAFHYVGCYDFDIQKILKIKADNNKTVKDYVHLLWNLLDKLDDNFSIICYQEFVEEIISFKTGKDFLETLDPKIIKKISQNTNSYSKKVTHIKKTFIQANIEVTEVDHSHFKTQVFFQDLLSP